MHPQLVVTAQVADQDVPTRRQRERQRSHGPGRDVLGLPHVAGEAQKRSVPPTRPPPAGRVPRRIFLSIASLLLGSLMGTHIDEAVLSGGRLGHTGQGSRDKEDMCPYMRGSRLGPDLWL